jgi:hypothetical protein
MAAKRRHSTRAAKKADYNEERYASTSPESVFYPRQSTFETSIEWLDTNSVMVICCVNAKDSSFCTASDNLVSFNGFFVSSDADDQDATSEDDFTENDEVIKTVNKRHKVCQFE